jgi:hypothetical protein
LNAPYEKPLFVSLDAALKWAYNSEPSLVGTAGIFRMMGYDNRDSSKDVEVETTPLPTVNPDLDRLPTGLDAVVQIGMIKSFVMRQPDPARLHLLSKYAHDNERIAARRALRDYLMPFLGSTIRPRYVIYHCVCRYYGKPIAFNDLASGIVYLVPKHKRETAKKRMGKAWRMVRSMSMDVDSLLKDIATRTEELAHFELKEMGLII